MAQRTLVETSCLLVSFFLLLVDLSCRKENSGPARDVKPILSGASSGDGPALKEILVGGKPSAWKIPSSPSDSLNKWAESLRFHVGDSLVWKYDGEKDINCNTTNPAARYSSGDTKVKLERSGPFFFISGSKSNCVQGEKLHIVVMSSRGGGGGGGFFIGSAPSPAPSPALLEAQAVPPATGSAFSLTSGIGVLGFVGLAIVLL